MDTPEISPDYKCDLERTLTPEEREWADELRDEFIIISNEHFTNIITQDDNFANELTLKLNEYLIHWMEKNPKVVRINEPGDECIILSTPEIGIFYALRQARDELCEYLEKEFDE